MLSKMNTKRAKHYTNVLSGYLTKLYQMLKFRGVEKNTVGRV
jgi:ribosomal protein S17E